MSSKSTFNTVARKMGKQLLEHVGRFNTELFSIALIEKDADLSVRDKNGMSALMIAASTRKSLATKAILRRDTDVSAINKSGMNALALAIIDGNKEIAQMVFDHGGKLTATQIIEISTNAKTEAITVLRDIAKQQDALLVATKKNKPTL